MPPLSPEQIADRKNGIGASEAACLVGEGFLTLMELWELKTGRRAEAKTNPMFERGHRLEPLVLAHYAGRHPHSLVVEPDPQTGIHPEHPWARASPDGLMLTTEGDLHGLEAKSVGLGGRRFWRDGYPVKVFLQCQWSMAVWGLPRWDLAALFEGPKDIWETYGEWTIDRDDELIEMLLAAGGRFWKNNVEADRAPRRQRSRI